MPLTFPSHLAPVLPLKLWRPRWFDGVALVTGAMAPDVAYLATGADGRTFADTHSWRSLFWWSLPVAVAYAAILRRYADTVAAHLPAGGRFGWRAYGRLRGNPHRWWTTAGSALLGAASHVGWDWLTHTDGWLSTVFGVRWAEVAAVPWWTVSDLTSTAVGALAVALVAARGVPRLLGHADDGLPTESTAIRPAIFWTAASAVTGVGVLATLLLPGASALAATGVRLLHVVALALFAGSAAVRVHTRFRSGTTDLTLER